MLLVVKENLVLGDGHAEETTAKSGRVRGERFEMKRLAEIGGRDDLAGEPAWREVEMVSLDGLRVGSIEPG